MAERKALVQIDGQLQELPSGDTLTGIPVADLTDTQSYETNTSTGAYDNTGYLVKGNVFDLANPRSITEVSCFLNNTFGPSVACAVVKITNPSNPETVEEVMGVFDQQTISTPGLITFTPDNPIDLEPGRYGILMTELGPGSGNRVEVILQAAPVADPEGHWSFVDYYRAGQNGHLVASTNTGTSTSAVRMTITTQAYALPVALDGAEVVAAIDTQLGQTDWKTGGGAAPEITPFNFEFDSNFVPATAITTNGLSFSGGTAGTDVNKFVVSTDPIPSGKWYWEVQFTSISNGGLSLVCGGVADEDVRSDFDTNEFYADGIALRSSAGSASVMYSHLDGAQANIENGTITQNPTMCFAFDADTGEMWMTYNGNVNASGTATRQKTNWTGEKYLAASATDTDVTGTVVLDAPSMNFAIPEGFSALGTSGTPVPAMTGAEIVAAIDLQLGQTNWKDLPVYENIVDSSFDLTEAVAGYTSENGVLTNVSAAGSEALFVPLTDFFPSGKWYWEMSRSAGTGSNMIIGIIPNADRGDADSSFGGTLLRELGMAFNMNGQAWVLDIFNGSAVSSFSSTDRWAFAFDADTGELWVGDNTSANPAGSPNLTLLMTNPVLGVTLRDGSTSVTMHTDPDNFLHTKPADFNPLTGTLVEEGGGGGGASAVAELTDMNITPANLTTGDLNRPLGLISLDPTPSYGLLTQLQSLPVMGGYEIIAQNNFATNPGASLTAPNAHLYDEIHIYFFNIAAGGSLFSGMYPDGINPASYASTRMRIFGNNATPDTGITDVVGEDKFFIQPAPVTKTSGRIIWRGMKAGMPLSGDKVSGQESGDYFHHEHNIYQTLAEVQGLDFNTNSGNITSGTAIIVGIRNAVQIMAAPYNYTGTPGGVANLGRFVVPVNARIRSGAQGQFKTGTNNSAASSANISIAGGSIIGTISLPDTGDPVVNITADTDLTAGDVLEIVTTQAETFTDLYGSLLLEGRG